MSDSSFVEPVLRTIEKELLLHGGRIVLERQEKLKWIPSWEYRMVSEEWTLTICEVGLVASDGRLHKQVSVKMADHMRTTALSRAAD